MISVNVGSSAGTCSIGSSSFYRYVLRLAEVGLRLSAADELSLAPLSAVPHAYYDDLASAGHGWRVVPATSDEDWSVLEATPQRLRGSLETARRLLWLNAASVGITAGEIVDVENEIETMLAILQQAEDAGCSVNVSYVS